MLRVFTTKQMFGLNFRGSQDECGFSIYRGVLVSWDEDRDGRVLVLLDNLPCQIIDQLLVVQERKGCVQFSWKGPTPQGFRDGDSIEVESDAWSVIEDGGYYE